MKIIQNVLLLACAVVAILLAAVFFFRPAPIQASIPLLTGQMVKENEAKAQEELRKKEEEVKKQEIAEAVKRKAAQEDRMYQCKRDDDCIIVDSDPCGCLIGPKGVTAINLDFSFDFASMMEKKYENMKVCPQRAKEEKECSASARPVCRENHCKIIY